MPDSDEITPEEREASPIFQQAKRAAEEVAAMREYATLQVECEKRGLPVSLDALLRHILNNHAATLGAKDAHIELLRGDPPAAWTREAPQRAEDAGWWWYVPDEGELRPVHLEVRDGRLQWGTLDMVFFVPGWWQRAVVPAVPRGGEEGER
jgi:hypothetical protein